MRRPAGFRLLTSPAMQGLRSNGTGAANGRAALCIARRRLLCASILTVDGIASDTEFDGAPSAVKAARSVQSGGKSGDHFKGLPITIRREEPGHEATYGGRRSCPHRYFPRSHAVWPVWLSSKIGRFCLQDGQKRPFVKEGRTHELPMGKAC